MLTDAQRLAREIADLRRNVRSLSTVAGLAQSSVEGGPTEIYDDDGNLRQIVGEQPDGTFTTVDLNAPAPISPSAPVLSAGAGTLVVAWDGATEDGSDWPLDFDRVEVHVGSTPGFTPTDLTEWHAFHTTKGGSVTLTMVGGVEVYVVLVAVNTSQIESVPSIEVAGTPDAVVDQATVDAIEADVAAAEQAAADAQQSAAAAQTTADQAVTDAAAANADADTAQTTANAAQADADAAAADALAAANAADAAQSTADSKGKTLIQSTAPAAADQLPQNLWIDTTLGANTPKRWNGTAWVAVTDKVAQDAADAAAAAQADADAAQSAANAADAKAVNAQAAADAAQSDANAAQTAANAAQSTADQATFDANNITATQILNDAILTRHLTAGVVTAAEIAAGAVIAGKIAAGAVQAGTLAAGAVTAGDIAANAVTASTVAADAIGATAIAADAVRTEHLFAGAVTAAEIASGAVTAGKIAANAVTAGTIAAGAVQAGDIAAGAVTTGTLDALAVTAAKIAAGAVTADKIAAGAVEAGTIAAGAVQAGNVAADAITAGTIAAGAIDGMTITGAFIRTGVSPDARIDINVAPNPFLSGAYWPMIALWNESTAWEPGLLFTNYDASITEGVLSLVAPYPTGTDQPARIRLMSKDALNRRMIWDCNGIDWNIIGAGVADLVANGTNTFSFRNAGDEKVNFHFEIGQNVIESKSGSSAKNLHLKGRDVFINPTVTGKQVFFSKPTDNPHIMMAREDVFTALTLANDHLRCTTWGGNNYIPIRASNFNVSSDVSNKSGLVPLDSTSALDAVRAMRVYDYQTTQGAPEGETVPGRGLVAQEAEQVVPTMVTEPDESGQTVDLYALIGTLIGAVQELAARQ